MSFPSERFWSPLDGVEDVNEQDGKWRKERRAYKLICMQNQGDLLLLIGVAVSGKVHIFLYQISKDGTVDHLTNVEAIDVRIIVNHFVGRGRELASASLGMYLGYFHL